MDDEGENYLGVFNIDDTLLNYINASSEFYLNNGILTINKINNLKISFTQPLMLFCSDNENPPNSIESKLTNDYIIDNTISGYKIFDNSINSNKIINLVTDKILFNDINNIIYSDENGDITEDKINNNLFNIN